MVYVAHLAYGCPAGQEHQPYFTGGEPDMSILTLFGHKLCRIACGTDQLTAVSRSQFYVVNYGTQRNILQGQCISDLDVNIGSGYNYVPVLESIGCQYISLFAICVMEKGDVCTPVGIIFYSGNLCRNSVLV